MLGLSVLADSAMEHYRGSFRNPAMVLPLVASSLTIALNGYKTIAGRREVALPLLPKATQIGSAAIGLIGFGFHAYNITKRPGGVRLINFFYGAPIGAPGALILSGVMGAMADALAEDKPLVPGNRIAPGRVVGAIAAVGIMGTVGEAALLHFRGAYHNPFMYVPVVLPPIAAASLSRDVIADTPSATSRNLLLATAAMGLIGAAFHAYGVHRNMGGWHNWRQNLLAGPPLPAPPSFTGLAIAGLGALMLMRKKSD